MRAIGHAHLIPLDITVLFDLSQISESETSRALGHMPLFRQQKRAAAVSSVSQAAEHPGDAKGFRGAPEPPTWKTIDGERGGGWVGVGCFPHSTISVQYTLHTDTR